MSLLGGWHGGRRDVRFAAFLYMYPVTPSPTGGDIFARWEYGPTPYDERHRITAFGVFNLRSKSK